MFHTVLIVVHLLIVVALVGVVLLQRSEGGGLGIGGGGGGFFTSRGTANILTRTTAILAGLFFVTTIVLTIMARMQDTPASILGTGGAGQAIPLEDATRGSGAGLLDTLRGVQDPAAPATPAAPAEPTGPQVPKSE
ncbi:preprotein translocase subunit SecG [Segnochrobactraceae bacterium EtOH-i3]